MFFGGRKEDFKKCPKCGYKFYIKPFPKVCPNPNCLQPLETHDSFADHIDLKMIEEAGQSAPQKVEKKHAPPTKAKNVQDIKISRSTAARKLPGVRVKKKKPRDKVDLNKKVIVFPSKGRYFKNFGVISENRVMIYNKNPDYSYIQELSFNLDYIASSILGGEIDRLVLQSEVSNALEQVLYLKKDTLLFFVYGVFTNKQGMYILQQMRNHLKNLLIGKDLDNLSKMDLHKIKNRMDVFIKHILKEYMGMTDIISDKDITPIDDWIRFDYFGMSYRSIGTISKILGSDLKIDIDPNIPESQQDDLKESLITAKIEAIAANTMANTKAVPKYLSVKLGYEKYRYIIFEKLENDYYIYMLAEGNLAKCKPVVMHLTEIVKGATKKAFSGDLKPFVELKKEIIRFFFPPNIENDQEGRIFK
ncbi:MAG: hypothetical protein GF364_17405 [Candidatus Lokiarchaeota archaeon]|nr:hypothetical protein [Candidatus Lokiarchaeota archaeon]